MNKFTENLYLKIKTKIWWLLLGLVVFCVLWHKKIASIFKSNVIEGAESNSSIIHIVPNSASVSDGTTTATSSGSGSGGTTTAPASNSVSGGTTTAPSSGSGSGGTTTAPSSGSGSGGTTTAPSSGSGSGGTTTAPSSNSGSGGTTATPTPSTTPGICDPEFEVGDEVQVQTSQNGKLEDGTVIKITPRSDGKPGCEYHIKFCSDGKIHIFDESEIYPQVEGGSCPATSKKSTSSGKKSTGKRGSASKTLHPKTPVAHGKSTSSKSSDSTASNLPNSSYGCNEFTVMVTNREVSEDGKTCTFTTTGDRGSMPCPFNNIVKAFGSTAQYLNGWIIIETTVVDGSNTLVYYQTNCGTTSGDEKWSYISATDSSLEKASVEIKSNSKTATSAKDSTYKIFYTYRENHNAHTPNSTTSNSPTATDKGHDDKTNGKSFNNPTAKKAPVQKRTTPKPTTPKRTTPKPT